MDSDKLLRDFLRNRCEVTTPYPAGPFDAVRRRAPRSHRHPIATPAGGGCRIRREQGRERHSSARVLTLARALGRDGAITGHLCSPALGRTRF